MTYEEWIENYRQTKGILFVGETERSVLGMCEQATKEMVKAFPELKRVRGHVSPGGPHWWCVTESGEVVDPTVSQWKDRVPAGTVFIYHPFDESKADQLPTGKCMDCGGHLYYNAQFCDESCARATCSYLGMEWPEKGFKYNPTDKPCYYG